jgi:protein-disulfide isomerase
VTDNVETPGEPQSVASAPRRAAWRTALDTIATIAIIVASAFIVRENLSGAGSVRLPAAPPTKKLAIPGETISIANAALKGSDNAPLVMIEFTDFQCPYCGRFARDIWPQIQKEYVDSGKVRLALRQLPLPIHSMARKAAVASLCAGSQGTFWPMHDSLFGDQANLDVASLEARASTLRLDQTQFKSCLADPATEHQIDVDVEYANKTLKVTGTPAFFFGRPQPDGRINILTTVAGAMPVEEFRKQIEAAVRMPH